jgi:hypothetical protein
MPKHRFTREQKRELGLYDWNPPKGTIGEKELKVLQKNRQNRRFKSAKSIV